MSALARIALTPCGRSMLTRMNVPLAARAMQTSAGTCMTFCFFSKELNTQFQAKSFEQWHVWFTYLPLMNDLNFSC